MTKQGTTVLLTSVTILVIVCVIGSLWYKAKVKPKQSTQGRNPDSSQSVVVGGQNPLIERFQQQPESNRTLDEPIEDHQRTQFGMERCDALFTTDSNISNTSYNTMLSMIGGHRIKRWKPDANDPANANMKSNANKEYCYFYNDAENQVQDYIMRHNACDTRNPIFNGNPIITNVFTTNYADKAHTVPVEKCVVEIDTQAAQNPQHVEDLWQKWGKTDCHQLLTDLRDDITRVRQGTTSLNTQYTILYSPFMTNSNMTVSMSNNLSKCHRSNQDYLREYTDLSGQYTLLSQQLDAEKRSVTQQFYDNLVLQEQYETLSNNKTIMRNDYVREEANAKSCDRSHKECTNNRETTVFNYTVMQQNNQLLRENNIVLAEDVYSWTQNYHRMHGMVQTCSNNVASERQQFQIHNTHYINSNNLYKTCISERAAFSNNATQILGRYESYSNQYYKCEDDVFENNKKYIVEQEKLTACNSRVSFLEGAIKNLQNTIDSVVAQKKAVLQDNTNTMNEINKCESVIGDLESTIEELKKRRDAMLQELDNLNKALKDAEQSSLDKQIDILQDSSKVNMQATIEATMRAAELSCAAVQSRASDLRNQITEIKTAKMQAESMPSGTTTCPGVCTPSRKQCLGFAKKLCSPLWTLELWRDGWYGGDYYKLTSDDVGVDGMSGGGKGKYSWFIPRTRFGTSSFKLTYPPYADPLKLVVELRRSSGRVAWGPATFANDMGNLDFETYWVYASVGEYLYGGKIL
jgi:hypothetical protein